MAAWPYPKVVAHRGGGTLAPENTLGAIRFGASLGFKAVEFDVMLAADGTPMLINDETTERTTGVKGRVAQMRPRDGAAAVPGASRPAEDRHQRHRCHLACGPRRPRVPRRPSHD